MQKKNNELLSFIKHTANQPGIAKTITPDYYIADATKLPFRDHSISVIYSIYFTDVVLLSSLWPEIKRVLKPKGSFIHFGLLQYHFNRLSECYSVEDLKQEIQNTSFSISAEQWDRTNPLGCPQDKSTRVFKNWRFIATKNIV